MKPENCFQHTYLLRVFLKFTILEFKNIIIFLCEFIGKNNNTLNQIEQ